MRRARVARSSALVRTLVIGCVVVFVVFLALPCVALLLRVTPGAVLARLGDESVRAALRLSLLTSLLATAAVVAFGTPTAYVLATRDFRGRRLLETLILLPMVLPPTVAGLALLLAFGRMGLAGRWLWPLGISLPFSTAAVIVAQTFMAAPFFIASARAGFAAVDTGLLDAASTLRATEFHRFRRVMLPLAMPSLLAGVSLSAARAIGEFGATIMFAGNLPNVTQTMPLAVYVALQSDLDTAVVLSVLLLVMSLGLLLGLRAAPSGWLSGGAHARRARATPPR